MGAAAWRRGGPRRVAELAAGLAAVGLAAGRALPGGSGAAAQCEGVPQWMVLDKCVPLKIGESHTDISSTTKQGGLTVGGNAYSIDAASGLDEAHPFFRLELQAVGGLACQGRLSVHAVGVDPNEGGDSELNFASTPGDPAPAQMMNLSGLKTPYKERYTVSVYTPSGVLWRPPVPGLSWQDNPGGACPYTLSVHPVAVTKLEDGTPLALRATPGEWSVFSWPSALAHPREVTLSAGVTPHGCALQGTVIGGGNMYGPARWDGSLKIWPGGTEPLPITAVGQSGATWIAAFALDGGAGAGGRAGESGCDYSVLSAPLPVTDLRSGVTHMVHVTPDGVSPALFAIPFRGPRVFDTAFFGVVESGECNITTNYMTDQSVAYPTYTLKKGELEPVLLPVPSVLLPDNRYEDDLLAITLGMDGNTGSCSFPITLTESQNFTLPAGEETVDLPAGPAGRPSLTLVELDCEALDCTAGLGFRVASGECGGAVGLADETLPADWGVTMDFFKAGDLVPWSPPPAAPPLSARALLFLDIKSGACGWTVGRVGA